MSCQYIASSARFDQDDVRNTSVATMLDFAVTILVFFTIYASLQQHFQWLSLWQRGTDPHVCGRDHLLHWDCHVLNCMNDD